MPEEAETVRTMFRLYLECGSVGTLAEELARRGVMAKVRSLASGRTKGGGPYSVGALAHFLKNRFYLGEVVYRGETHAGEHEPIVDRATFETVQAQLAENMRARRIRVEHSPAVLISRLFDDRGNRMTPTHSNKDGVRYRYYVSHALLQRRNEDAGGVARVPAMPLEKLVVEAVRARTQLGATLHSGFSDREVIDAYVERIVVRPNAIDIELREETRAPATDGAAPSLATDVPGCDSQATSSIHATVITLPWSAPAFLAVKGVLHLPAATPTLKQETRDAIVLAIAKARSWIDDLTSGRIQSFTQLAQQERKVERHIRLLIPLAFTPPQTLAAIIAGTGSTDLTVTALSQAIPYAWRSQVAPNQA
jgi:hypothetical protein